MTDKQQDTGTDEVELSQDELAELENPTVADSNDEEDVPEALERATDDGKGGAVVPKSDFDSFSGDDVENDDEDADNADNAPGSED